MLRLPISLGPLASTSRLTLSTTSASTYSRRLLSTTSTLSSADPKSPFNRPGPPPLPPKEQREFERLVKEKSNQSPFLDSSVRSSPDSSSEEALLHPDARRKPAPDFEGETNPSTGEVGGPKKDPLTWEREWTYGGRATDF